MKKILFMIACCLMATTENVLAQTGKIFLQHAGSITSAFNYNEMDKAIAAAAEGDTLFLSRGGFSESSTINKSISIIGSGADDNNSNRTYFEWNGSPTIKNETGAIGTVRFEGVYFINSIDVESSIDNLSFKKCYFQNGISLNNNNAIYKQVLFDRCRISDIRTWGNIEDLTVKNCKVDYTYFGQGGQTNSSCKFINCNIRQVNTNTKALFVNSIINEVGNGTSNYLGTNVILVNTLYHKLNGYDPMEKTSQQDCWATTETLINSNSGDIDCNLTTEQRQAAGYLGVDGTVVGVEGGLNPYSLTFHAPSINSSSANVDLTNKKVTINVNVTAN